MAFRSLELNLRQLKPFSIDSHQPESNSNFPKPDRVIVEYSGAKSDMPTDGFLMRRSFSIVIAPDYSNVNS